MLAVHQGADVLMTIEGGFARTLADAERFAARLRAAGRNTEATRAEIIRLDTLALYLEHMDVDLMVRELGWPAGDYVGASYVHDAARCGAVAVSHTHTVIVALPVHARDLAASR